MFSHEYLRSVATLCAGVALLLGVAVFFSSLPGYKGIAHNASTQSAAAWLYDAQNSYGGYPIPLTYPLSSCIPSSLCFFLAGQLSVITWTYVATSPPVVTGVISIHPAADFIGQSGLATVSSYQTGGFWPGYLGPPLGLKGADCAGYEGYVGCTLSCNDTGCFEEGDSCYYQGPGYMGTTFTSGLGCYNVPGVDAGWTTGSAAVGTPATVAPGSPVTIEWATQPYQSRIIDVGDSYHCPWFDIFCGSGGGGGGSAVFDSTTFSSGSSGSGSGWAGTGGGTGPGSQTFNAPMAEGIYTYTLTASGGAPGPFSASTQLIVSNSATSTPPPVIPPDLPPPFCSSTPASPALCASAPVCGFAATPTTITADQTGQNITVSWCCPSGTYSSSSGDSNFSTGGALSGSQTFPAPTAPGTYDYSVSCLSSNGNSNGSASVTVLPASITSFNATPSRVRKGNTTTLTWDTLGMASCQLKSSAGSGTLSSALSTVASGGLVQTINAVTTFTLSCTPTAGGGAKVQSKTVTLIPILQEL